MKVLGVGLSRTGTMSLCRALNILGFRTIHWEPERLRDVINGSCNTPDFKRYDDVDAVTDLPAALFYNELCNAYPSCKLILTVRDIDAWFSSVKFHYDVRVPANLAGNPAMQQEARATQALAYGSERVNEFIYKKRYLDHNQAVLCEYPDTLVMDITKGDGWDALCKYLNVPVPNVAFPKANMTPKRTP